MADVCDCAANTTSLYLSVALSAVKKQTGRGPIWLDAMPTCRGCGETIGNERLKAMPDVELCIECAWEKENGN